MSDDWRPRVRFPSDVVRPVRVASNAAGGPTQDQAEGPRWRRASKGLYVPRSVRQRGEQRIVEVEAGLPVGGLLTGWAALRVMGAGFFDGLDPWGKPMSVPVLVDADQRVTSSRARRVMRDRALPRGVLVDGLRCAPPERAAIDAMRLADHGRDAVVVLDMAVAAGLVTLPSVKRAWSTQIRRVGAALVRFGLEHARSGSRSPAESRLRLVWALDAGLPEPLLNPEVRDWSGRLIGLPDLLEPRSGVVAEYDGAAHRDRDRHRGDNARRERFLEAGLEPVTVVAGDSVAEIVRRLRSARRRAAARPGDQHRWMVASEEPTPGISA